MMLDIFHSPPSWLGSNWLAPYYLVWMLKGALVTAGLAFCVCLFSTMLAIVLTAIGQINATFVRIGLGIFLRLHRNTPLMVQLLIWYFGVSGLLPESWGQWLNTPHQWQLSASLTIAWPSYEILSAVCAITLYSASFIAGDLASGLRGVDQGQHEAAIALGMNRWQGFRWVILPQALHIIRQPLVSQFTAVIKNTSMAMAIGVAELSYTSRQVETETLLTFQAFAVASLLYIVLVMLTQHQAGKTPHWKHHDAT